MNKTLILIAGVLLIVAAAFAAGIKERSSNTCLTQQQVRESVERSREGISMTCNELILQRNLARQDRPSLTE